MEPEFPFNQNEFQDCLAYNDSVDNALLYDRGDPRLRLGPMLQHPSIQQLSVLPPSPRISTNRAPPQEQPNIIQDLTTIPSQTYEGAVPDFAVPSSFNDGGSTVNNFADGGIVNNLALLTGPTNARADFKHYLDIGFRQQYTRSDGLQCGIFALGISLNGLALIGALDFMTDSYARLEQVLKSPSYDRCCSILLQTSNATLRSDILAQLRYDNYLSVYQLAIILQVVGDDWGKPLQLGVCTRSQPQLGHMDTYSLYYVNLNRSASTDRPVQTVWVINDNARAMAQDGDMLLEHWSGFAPDSPTMLPTRQMTPGLKRAVKTKNFMPTFSPSLASLKSKLLVRSKTDSSSSSSEERPHKASRHLRVDDVRRGAQKEVATSSRSTSVLEETAATAERMPSSSSTMRLAKKALGIRRAGFFCPVAGCQWEKQSLSDQKSLA